MISNEAFITHDITKSEIPISGDASVKDQLETKMLNPKLETLNSKQTQMSETQHSELHSLLSFRFWICLGFRV